MAGKIFFKDWQLWQQMTFVLAMCIISVFCLGCGKLWYNNRLMRKQEIIDEEKRARYTEMRKAGVPLPSSKRGLGAEIPFGVRAIQGGVEVDGIWISRPATPNVEQQQPKTRAHAQQSVTTLIGTEQQPTTTEANKKGKQVVDDYSSRSTTDQRGSQSDASMLHRLTDAESLASTTTTSGTPRQSQFAPSPYPHSSSSSASRQPKPMPQPKHHHPHPRIVNGLNEETLRRLDGYSPSRTTTAYETSYTSIPASSRNSNSNSNPPRRPSQRSSASSSGESMESQPRSGVSARSGSGSGRSGYSSSRSSRMYNPSSSGGGSRAPRLDGRGPGYYTSVPGLREGARLERRDTYESSVTVDSAPLSGQDTQMPPPPEPTFGPGDLRVNHRQGRKVDTGFEVLPAGTLGGRDEAGAGEEEEEAEVRGLQPRPTNGSRGRGMSYTQQLRLENAAQNF